MVLLDWVLAEGTGVGFLRQLRTDRRTRELPVIMLTGRGMEADKVTGLEAGADDYITKPFSHRELLARIKAVIRRRAPLLCDDVVEIGGLRLDPAAHLVTAGGAPLDLWATEFRLLHFFMTHPERVYSRAQLLDEVWGDHVFVEERTVDVHIRRLRQALQPGGHDRLIETVRGTGYRLRRAPAQ
jgi:two-component system phosphate regulon response regulator PhoB